MADVTQNTPTNAAKGAVKPSHRSPVGFDISDPDAFQDKVLDGWAWVEKNIALVGVLIGALLLAGLIYSIMGWWGRRQERQAQEAYYTVEAKYVETKEGFDRARLKTMMPNMPQEKDAKPVSAPPTGDLAKDYGSTVDDLAKIARTYPATAAGAQAAILASDAYLSYQKPDQAVEVAQIPVHALGDGNLLGDLARMSWGNALSAKGDCKQAVEVWKPLSESKSTAFLAADASLRMGVCYEQLNQNDDAKKMYEKVTSDSSGGYDSPTTSTAKGLLRALQLKTQAPVPAPAKG